MFARHYHCGFVKLYFAISSNMNFGFNIYLVILICHYIAIGWRHCSTHAYLSVKRSMVNNAPGDLGPAKNLLLWITWSEVFSEFNIRFWNSLQISGIILYTSDLSMISVYIQTYTYYCCTCNHITFILPNLHTKILFVVLPVSWFVVSVEGCIYCPWRRWREILVLGWRNSGHREHWLYVSWKRGLIVC